MVRTAIISFLSLEIFLIVPAGISDSSQKHHDYLTISMNQRQFLIFYISAAKKAKFSPNYGCEEGKCGSCELKVNGKTKIRPCIGKVPAGPGPITLTEP
jgi:succinate dehydrogenase/fumarate reductase-like Fe-S protein